MSKEVRRERRERRESMAECEHRWKNREGDGEILLSSGEEWSRECISCGRVERYNDLGDLIEVGYR